jgi:thioredoxin reductase
MDGDHAGMIERMLRPVVASTIVLSPSDVERVTEVDSDLEVQLTSGSSERVAGVFVAAVARQRAPFAERLGCRILDSGGVEIDTVGRTTVPGVYAAGDMAHTASAGGPMVSLAAAIAAGQIAAACVVRDEIAS